MLTNIRYEAVELRDGDKGKFLGKGVSKAVKLINEKISETLIGMDPTLQSQIDQAMIDLDKTENKASAFFPTTGLKQYLLPFCVNKLLYSFAISSNLVVLISYVI